MDSVKTKIKYSIKELIDIGNSTIFCIECKGPVLVNPKINSFCSFECFEVYNKTNNFQKRT